MVFDGEGLAYYYKDLEKADWWGRVMATGNWNNALSDGITENEGYKEAKVSALEDLKHKLCGLVCAVNSNTLT